ncbi:hypothetical protein ElyMa_005376800 [Elysia marginata]|uniref:Anaphase-promoting complex subunit 1 n=1 Tax=Elysia marginata TaxID=1093978 RepID=A0AAV4EEI9_9GAST|nr:hypothetical protein ElyMa_005376800 [Elysia marginata]
MLYLLTQGSENMFKISPEVCLDAFPTKLIHFKFKETKTDELVLAGLQNGSVSSIYRSLCGKTCTISKIDLETNQSGYSEMDDDLQDVSGRERGASDKRKLCQPVACMCQVGTDFIAVASGEDIYTLRVIFGDVTAPRSLGSELISSESKISLKSLTDGFTPISDMASKTECGFKTVWCCLESSPFLVQVDVSKSQVILMIRVSWNQGQDVMRLERYLPSQPPASVRCDRRLPGIKNSITIPLQKDYGNNLKPLQGTKLPLKPDREKMSDLLDFPQVTKEDQHVNITNCQSDSSSSRNNSDLENCDNTSQNKIPYISISYDDGYIDKDKCKQVDQEQFCSREKENQTNFEPTTEEQVMPQATSCNISSLTLRFTEPPPIPPRQNSLECDIKLHCVTMSGNVLMIGTNFGGLLALPLTLVDLPGDAGIGGGLPLHLGILWHQQKALPMQQNDRRLRQRRGSTLSSYSTTSCLPVTIAQPQIPAGEVSRVLKAGTKMVSIYTQQEKAVLRPRSVSKHALPSSRSNSRNAGLFFPAFGQDSDLGGWDLVETETEDGPSLSVPNRIDPPENVSYITIWDHIAPETLAAIENYCFELS